MRDCTAILCFVMLLNCVCHINQVLWAHGSIAHYVGMARKQNGGSNIN